MENAHIFAGKLGEKCFIDMKGKEKDVTALIINIIRMYGKGARRMSFKETLKALEWIEKHNDFGEINVWEEK